MKLQRLFVNEPRANLLQKIPQNVAFAHEFGWSLEIVQWKESLLLYTVTVNS